MHEVLKKIQSFLDNKKVTKLERTRLDKDLTAVFERLSKDEYKKAGFDNNKFDIPDRTKEFFVYLEFYCQMGKTWAEILKHIDLKEHKEVIDLCPGYTPKVELAFFYAGYKGKVIAIDKDKEYLKTLVNFMDLFNPDFKVIPKNIDLNNKFDIRGSLIIANHVIDDLVVDYACNKWNIDQRDIYAKEGMLKTIWERIMKDKEFEQEVVPRIVDIFERITKKSGYLLISQYQSYIERLLELKEVPKYNKQILKKVIKGLDGFKQDKKLVEKALKGHKGYFKANECYVLKRS